MFSKNTYWLALSLKSQLRIKTEQILLETLEFENDYIEVSQLRNNFSNLSLVSLGKHNYNYFYFIYSFIFFFGVNFFHLNFLKPYCIVISVFCKQFLPYFITERVITVCTFVE